MKLSKRVDVVEAGEVEEGRQIILSSCKEMKDIRVGYGIRFSRLVRLD